VGQRVIDDAKQSSSLQIPNKLYFRIGEVSKIVGVKPYVLRFWETEFPTISPKKSGAGHRLYRRKDVETLLEIRELLHGKRFTIEGARQHLESSPRPAGSRLKPQRNELQTELFPPPPPTLDDIRRELVAILHLLRD
jgi:DNA-binding transcriptional MerR regulator